MVWVDLGLVFARQKQAQRLGQHAMHIGDELDQVGASQALVFLPRRHDGTVIDAEDIDSLDPCLLKSAVDFGFLEACAHRE